MTRRSGWLLGAGVAVLVAIVAVVLVVRSLDGVEQCADCDGPTGYPTSVALPTTKPGDPTYDEALSEPRVDDFYPQRGSDVVDALHYGLTLAWDPDAGELTGSAEISFRAARDADTLDLDLSEAMAVDRVSLDGEQVQATQRDDELLVDAAVRTDERHVLRVDYAGAPTPVTAPTTRGDLEDLGLTVTDEGHLWTMQEPFGAFTWYPVDDQPADKAYYDIAITAPGSWVGVANGELVARERVDGDTVTRWHLDAPTSSYLTTLAVGPYVESRYTSDSGVPVSAWTREGADGEAQALAWLPEALAYNEQILGDYPYDSLGAVVVDSESGMETTTMLTLGGGEYPLSQEVLVHEIAHQWYGDLVTPQDWRDLWMNEGMATLIQKRFEAEREGRTLDEVLAEYQPFESDMRRQTGPPGDPDPAQFGESIVYYGPALMWNDLRGQIGDEEFWRLVRAWPRVDDDGSVGRAEYLEWWGEQTGRELGGFFEAWLMGDTAPIGGHYPIPQPS